MPEKPTEPSQPFDVQVIHQLVRLMKRYDLTSIDLIEGATKIRLRRRGEEAATASGQYVLPSGAGHYVVPANPVTAGPALASTAAPPRTDAAAPAPAAPSGIVIESPMVGTYYASSAPDAPPFVSVGTVVRPDTTVCVIEAMKVFTDIPANVSGTITEVLVKNGQPVEFGQPMFRVNPA